MEFLWLFYGFSTSHSKKATEFNTSFHLLMPSGFDETIGCNTSKKAKVMKQGTMNILFFRAQNEIVEKSGEAPVLMRITINGDYDDARIQRSVPLNLWNAAKGCSKGRDRASVALNTYIAELHARALEKHKELVLEQALITPKLILKRVFGKDTGMRTLLGTMQEGIEEMESLVNIDYSPVTINRYKNVVKKLRQLIPSYYGKEDITFHGIDTGVHPCVRHLPENGRRLVPEHDSPLHGNASRNSPIWHWQRNGCVRIPFYGYKMEQDETDPVFLTYDELQAVIKQKIHGSPA